eukprot:gene3509-3779_t
MDESVEFKLCCELLGHQEDVRAVCVGDIGVVTSSRDTTIKVWAEEGPTSYSLVHTLSGHSKYVGAVAYAEPKLLPDMANGAIISGCFDATVGVWDVVTATLVHSYRGHQYQVTAVALLPNGDIASASVDKSVRLWRQGRQVGELLGHEGPVLCLAVTEAGELLSGSGDHTIRRWQNKSCAQVYKGHTDTVRGVCVLPGVGFVSGSHDCSLRVWSLAGEVLTELHGHTAIIYSVAATHAGLIASGSEDNTVRLWSAGSGAALQVLAHPGCVWAVAFTAKGDLVTGCSDAVGRLWSSTAERQDANGAAALSKLLEDKAATAREAAAAAGSGSGGQAMEVDGGAGAGGGGAAAGLPAGLKVSEAFELAQPGAKEGETKIIREGDGSIAAYGWDANGCVWQKIGTVVDAPEPGSISAGGRRWYAGREWDHVFDVEMDSGMKLKLALDAGENPYIVADRFLEQHDLPGEFKEQVVKFIIDNTGGGKPGAAAVADLPITGGFCDPFTGGSSSSSERRPAAAAAPQFQARGFTDITEALRKKLLEFNTLLQEQPDVGPDALISDEEAAAGGLLDQLLGSMTGAVSTATSAGPSQESLGLIVRLLRWPAAQLFPVLDVVRCLVLHPAAAAHLAATAGSMSAPGIGNLSGAIAGAAISGVSPALQTSLRLLANCFKQQVLRDWVLQNREFLLDGFAGCYSAGSAGATKAVRLSMATVLLNYAVAAAEQPGSGSSEEAAMQLLSGLEELLGALPAQESDAALRTVLALGTMLIAGGAGMVTLAKDLGLVEQVGRFGAAAAAAGHGSNAKLVGAVQEVQQLLR